MSHSHGGQRFDDRACKLSEESAEVGARTFAGECSTGTLDATRLGKGQLVSQIVASPFTKQFRRRWVCSFTLARDLS